MDEKTDLTIEALWARIENPALLLNHQQNALHKLATTPAAQLFVQMAAPLRSAKIHDDDLDIAANRILSEKYSRSCWWPAGEDNGCHRCGEYLFRPLTGAQYDLCTSCEKDISN